MPLQDDGPQVTEAAAKTLAGHAAEKPSQVSAGSQMPLSERQMTPASLTRSGGQTLEVPVHVSAGSQMPMLVRHWKLLPRS